MLAKVGKTLLEYGTIPWTSELHTWRSQRALGWRKPSYVPQPDAGGMSGGGPAPIFPQNLVSSQPVTPVMALEFNSEPRTRSWWWGAGCGGVVGGWVLLLLKSGRNSLKHIFPAPCHPPHPSKCGRHAIVCTAETDVIF